MTRHPSADDPYGADLPRGRHDSRHDPLLRAAISGEVDGRDPRLRAQIESCDHCREQLEALVEVRELLDGAGEDEREVLERDDLGSGWNPDVPGRELVAPFVREQLALAQAAKAQAVRPRIRREWWQSPWVAAAAAGILVLGWFARGSLQPATQLSPSARLGVHEAAEAGGLSIVDFADFAWKLPPVPGGRYRLTVRDGRPDGDGAVLAEVFPTGPSHTFSREVTRTWPDLITGEVQAQDVFGRSVGPSASGIAKR
jgi:hypothetical protein